MMNKRIGSENQKRDTVPKFPLEGSIRLQNKGYKHFSSPNNSNRSEEDLKRENIILRKRLFTEPTKGKSLKTFRSEVKIKKSVYVEFISNEHCFL